MPPPDSLQCPTCRVSLLPGPLSPDPEALVCPRCGVDRLALMMQEVAGKATVWDYRDVRLYLRWSSVPPAPAELVAAKRLIPALRRLPHGQLGRVLGQEPVWLVGVIPCQDARALFTRARELGLSPELAYLPETRGTSQDPRPHDEHEEEEEG